MKSADLQSVGVTSLILMLGVFLGPPVRAEDGAQSCSGDLFTRSTLRLQIVF